MKDIEELIKKIIKKAKDKDATYLYGVEYSNNTDPAFRCAIRFTKEGVTPVVIGTTSKRDLKKTLLSCLEGESARDINIRYHEAQIEVGEQGIRFHKNMIEDYKKKGEAQEFHED